VRRRNRHFDPLHTVRSVSCSAGLIILELSRSQVLAHRRRAGHLETRLSAGIESRERAAHAGLQDSMPRAAVFSAHARVEAVGPFVWEEPPYIQVWGPRFNAYV